MTCLHPHPQWEDTELFCNDCGEYNFQPEGEPCVVCHGTGIDDHAESWCECAAGEAEWAKIEAQFAWMIPHVAAASRAEREGDFELARDITEGCGVRYSGRVA